MRILVLFSSRLLDSRGTPSRSRGLTRSLIAQPDNEVLVLSGDPPGSVEQALDTAHESLAGESLAQRLAAATARFRPDLIYGQTEKAVPPLVRLAAETSLKVVDLHGDLAAEKWEQRWRPFTRRLRGYLRHRLEEWRWLGRMDAFTVVSHPLAARVRRLARPTVVIPGGVDLELFSARPATPTEQVTVAYAGNFRPYQGLADLVEAMTGLDRRFRLMLVGDPNGGERLLAAARQRLGDRLRVLDPVPYEQVPALLAQADVLTVPRPDCRSARFGFPSKLPEYLALGRAVVVSDVGDQPLVIRDGDNGLVVPAGDPTALAAALERLGDPGLRTQLATAARQDAQSRFSWERIGHDLQAFLRGLCADHGPLSREEAG